jgi:hypothetical protein
MWVAYLNLSSGSKLSIRQICETDVMQYLLSGVQIYTQTITREEKFRSYDGKVERAVFQ